MAYWRGCLEVSWLLCGSARSSFPFQGFYALTTVYAEVAAEIVYVASPQLRLAVVVLMLVVLLSYDGNDNHQTRVRFSLSAMVGRCVAGSAWL